MASSQHPGPPFPGPQNPGQPYSAQPYSGPPPVPQQPGPQYGGSPPGRPSSHGRRTNPMGAAIAAAGVVIYLISVFLDWKSTPEEVGGESFNGFDLDGINPFIAWFGIGLVLALGYAITRARGKQHRGLTLVTMALGIAAVLHALSYVFGAPGTLGGNNIEFDTEIGPWIALLGGIVWSIGAGLLAKEPEGDDDWRDTSAVQGGRY